MAPGELLIIIWIRRTYEPNFFQKRETIARLNDTDGLAEI